MVGTFYDTPTNLEISEHELNFDADRPWPVIIAIGDPPDAYSCHVLALIAIENRHTDFFEFWALKSAFQGYADAQQMFGLYRLEQGDVYAAVYWETRAKTNFSKMVVAQFLFEATDENSDPCLAENILVDLVRNGYHEALYYLGVMHTKLEHPDFRNNHELGIRYLRESVRDAHDEYASKLLAEVRDRSGWVLGVAAAIVVVGAGLTVFRRIWRS
jgi:hypothetical protein